MDVKLVPTQQNLNFGEHCNNLTDKIRDISRRALSDKNIAKYEQKIFSEVLSVVDRDIQITVYKQFLDAQKQLVNLIPKSKQGAVYRGFSSIFEETVKAYITEEREGFKKELESKKNQQITSLKNRIEFLEGLCENNGIDINPHNPKGSVID